VVASLLEPVTAAVAASLILDERLGALGVVGTLLILAAVAGLAGEEEPVAVPPPG
jgi:DME family drug/metabolite transporter